MGNKVSRIHRTGVSTFASPHEPTLKPKACKRASPFTSPREESQNFSPSLKRKKLKHANTQATQAEKRNERVI
jgi:hypothetical protein